MTAPGSSPAPPAPPAASTRRIADYLEAGADWVGDLVVFLLCRVALVELARGEVASGRHMANSTPPDYAVDALQAEFLFKAQREDGGHTDDKVKQLLTLSSSLATIILAFVRDVQPRWLVVLTLGVLFACVFLCVRVLGVRTAQQPTPEDASMLDETALKRVWARDLMASTHANAFAHRLRVDLYRTAGRYFRAAFLLTPVLAYRTVPRRDAAGDQVAATQQQAAALERVARAVDSLEVRLGAAIRLRPAGVPTATPAQPARGAAAGPPVGPRGTPPRPER